MHASNPWFIFGVHNNAIYGTTVWGVSNGVGIVQQASSVGAPIKSSLTRPSCDIRQPRIPKMLVEHGPIHPRQQPPVFSMPPSLLGVF